MKFLSVDIETTGLNPAKHGVIQVGAVYADLFDLTHPIYTFETYINPNDMVWDNYCLKLHEHWLSKVLYRLDNGGRQLKGQPDIENSLDDAMNALDMWLSLYVPINGKTKLLEKSVPAGKNFGSFDLQFLKNSMYCPQFIHRTLDPAMYYIREGDAKPPDLALCKKRAIDMGCHLGLDVAHTALADALDVVTLLQFGVKLCGK